MQRHSHSQTWDDHARAQEPVSAKGLEQYDGNVLEEYLWLPGNLLISFQNACHLYLLFHWSKLHHSWHHSTRRSSTLCLRNPQCIAHVSLQARLPHWTVSTWSILRKDKNSIFLLSSIVLAHRKHIVSFFKISLCWADNADNAHTWVMSSGTGLRSTFSICRAMSCWGFACDPNRLAAENQQPEWAQPASVWEEGACCLLPLKSPFWEKNDSYSDIGFPCKIYDPI